MPRYIATLFDYNKFKPLLTAVRDESGSKLYKLWHPGTKKTIKEVEESQKEITKLFDDKVVCNDFKTHLKAFNLNLDKDYDVYDPCVDRQPHGTIENSKKSVIRILKDLMKHEPQKWSKLVADASIPYQHLENRGYLYYGKVEHPTFFLDTYTGRARSIGFPIHGKGKDEDIKPVDENRDIFVHFDWISADIRMGSFMADDDILSSVYEESDPYSYVAEHVDLPREDIKLRFMRALYNGDFDDGIFELYYKFADWMKGIHSRIDKGKPVCNIVGRPYYPVENHTGNHGKKSAANAPLQGSIAAAISAACCKIRELDKEVLFVDRYDSIVCACSKSVVNDVVNEVGNIMYRPFSGILDEDYTMPYKVDIGKSWMKWKTLRTVR